MDTEEINDLAWRIMLHNEEYDDMDRVFAINGLLRGNFDELSEEEQDDILKRLAIGIQSSNISMREAADKINNWRRLPKVEISGNEKG